MPFRRPSAPIRAVLTAAAVAFAAALFAPVSAPAAEGDLIISIKDHRFDPAELKVPAGKRVTLIVHNEDGSVEEFESGDLHLEKIIPGKSSAKFRVGPLRPGTYTFFGEFHEDTAQGRIVVD